MGTDQMAWEKHGDKVYYYRSVRKDGKVTKEYFGSGPAGVLAAGLDAQRRAEDAATRAAKVKVDVATAATRDLTRTCGLLAVAPMFAAGYHCPSRHSWRTWRNGRRILAQSAEPSRR